MSKRNTGLFTPVERPPVFQNSLTNRLADFLGGIGLPVEAAASFPGEPFLPGIFVENGRIFVDEATLRFPGDLLHEAGHLAVTPSAVRNALAGDVGLPDAGDAGLEVMVIAWSYAACCFLNLDPCVVFHEHGYRGNSQGLLLGFSLGVFPGAPGLQAAGMSAFGAEAVRLGVPPFPQMRRWLRE